MCEAVSPYRFPVPPTLTAESVLHVARRLSEASREGFDIEKARITGRFYEVPAKKGRSEDADRLRAEILLVLQSAGRSLRNGEIAKRLHVSPGLSGYLLDTLVQRGAVRDEAGGFSCV